MMHFYPRRMREKLYPLPILETNRLILRSITAEDEADMYEYSRDPETSRYLLWEPHPSLSFTRDHIRRVTRQYKTLGFLDWALVNKSDGRMIGTVGFTRLSGIKESGEIGYVLSPAYHRKGLAPEAIKAVLAYAFDTLRLKNVTCRIMEDNVPSRKVAGRLGFQMLGFEKVPVIKRGASQKIALYQLTRDQYQKD